MIGTRVGMVVVVLSLVLNGASAAGCGTKQSGAASNETAQITKQSKGKKPPISPTPISGGERTVNNDIKVLAEGGHSRVADTFVAVAREAETYTALRNLGIELPSLSADFFKTNAVIAAFLGVRRTGGYGVNIVRAANGGIRVVESSPPADAMVTQVITAPFKMVSVPIREDGLLPLEIDEPWKGAMRSYRVTAGEFTTGGGFAGRLEKLKLEGDFRVMRYRNLTTFVFSLVGLGGAKERALSEIATGTVHDDGRITIARLNAGSLVDVPREPLSATGQFTNKEDNLSLEFKSLPTNIADGYSGQGKLEAVATSPPPQKRKSSLMEEP